MPKHSDSKKTIRAVVSNPELIKTELEVQRGKVWSLEVKSDLIHTFLEEYYVFPILTSNAGDQYFWILDGKQRLTTIIDYCDEEVSFALYENTRPVHFYVPDKQLKKFEEHLIAKNFEHEKTDIKEAEGTLFIVDISNRFFGELPKLMKDKILDYNLTFAEMSGHTEEQQDIMFDKINSGKPLKTGEKMRAIGGSELMRFAKEVLESPFFQTVAMTDSVKKSIAQGKEVNMSTHIETIYQAMYLMSDLDKNVGLGGVEITDKFARQIKENGLPEDLKKRVVKVVEFLGKALPVREHRIMTKASIPILMLQAEIALKQKKSAKKFGGWVQKFFEDNKSTGSAYKKHVQGGSAKDSAVKGRRDVMNKHYDKNIDNSPDYKKPELTKSQLAKLEKEAKLKAKAEGTDQVSTDSGAIDEVLKGGKGQTA